MSVRERRNRKDRRGKTPEELHRWLAKQPRPTTWTRPYNPQPGMIGQLNFDGAKPRQEQTQLQRKRQRRQFYRGGVAGASVRGNHQ